LFERDLSEARRYPEPFGLLEREVKPERLQKDPEKYPRLVQTWWKYWHSRKKLYDNIASNSLSRVLARSRVSDHHMVDSLPVGIIYTEQLVVFVLEEWSDFAVLQSSIHDVWSRTYASTMKNDVRYIPTDCFETFPRPSPSDDLERIGERYWSARQDLKLANQVGLTGIYNYFHNPKNESREFRELRKLHMELDQAVFEAYGFDQSRLDHDFYQTSRGWRFTLSDVLKSDIVNWLLDLNQNISASDVTEAKARGNRNSGGSHDTGDLFSRREETG
jgi:hypothetical protein